MRLLVGVLGMIPAAQFAQPDGDRFERRRHRIKLMANEPDAELPGVRSTTAQFQRNPKLLERVSMFLFLRDAFQQHSLLSTVTGHKTAETKVVQRVAIGIDFLVGFGGHSPESKLQHNPNEGQSVGNSISMADGPSVTRRQIAVMHFGGVLSEWPPPPVNVICETWH